MEYVDMHMHTIKGNKSYCSLEELLSMAKENGVRVISFTDHNTLKAYFDLKKKYSSEEIERIYGVKIVVGVEVNSRIGEQCNDMLVYNIADLEKFQTWLQSHTDLDKTVSAQREQLEFYKQVSQKLGLTFDEEDLVITEEEPYAGRIIARALFKYLDKNSTIIPKEELQDGTLFFMRQCNNPNSEYYFDISKYRPKVEDLIKVAHECGGLVFMAHPGAYNGNSEAELQAYLEFGKILGCDGVEIDNSFNQDITFYREVPIKFCIDNNLRMSAGTDIHTRDDLNHTKGISGVMPRYSGVGIIQLPDGSTRKMSKKIIEPWAKYWYFQKEICHESPNNENKNRSEI